MRSLTPDAEAQLAKRRVSVMVAILVVIAIAFFAAGNFLWVGAIIGIASVIGIGWPLGSGSRKARIALRTVLLTVTTIACIVALLALSLRVSYAIAVKNPHRSVGPNATWARHQWVGESHSEAEYVVLADELKLNKITDVFFHVGPLDSDGTVPPEKFRNAPALITILRARAPGVRLQAWLGQMDSRVGGPLDITDPNVGDRVVRTAVGFLDLGFDGIHYDIEPIRSGDKAFLELLMATKNMTRERGAILSVAASSTDVMGAFGDLSRALFPLSVNTWSIDFYVDVAAIVDQIAVMMYGPGIPRDWIYSAMVARNTARILDAAGDRVTLFMGIPSYDGEDEPGFSPAAENVQSALIGVQKGLEGFSDAELRNFGVAIYAQWTTDQSEWATYRETWLRATP